MVEIPSPERFYAEVEVKSGDVHLWCPACHWSANLASQQQTIGAQLALAREHVADQHRPESRCEVCDEPVSSWEYERFTENEAGRLEGGRGLIVKPCGHQVQRIVAVIP